MMTGFPISSLRAWPVRPAPAIGAVCSMADGQKSAVRFGMTVLLTVVDLSKVPRYSAPGPLARRRGFFLIFGGGRESFLGGWGGRS